MAWGRRGPSFVDNIILGGGAAATLPGPYPGAVWRHNMVWQTDRPRRDARRQRPGHRPEQGAEGKGQLRAAAGHRGPADGRSSS